MNLIVAVDKNWAIGNNNELLVSIPDDMKFFREHTTGNVIIMGKETLALAIEGSDTFAWKLENDHFVFEKEFL